MSANLELERAVLGIIMQQPTILAEKGIILDCQDFSDPRNKYIVTAINCLVESGQDNGSIMVKDYLASHNLLSHVGEDYFYSLFQINGTLYNIVSCITRLHELGLRRAISEVCYSTSQQALNMATPVEAVLNNTMSALTSVNLSSKNTLLDGKQMATLLVDTIEINAKSETLPYIQTGFTELDQIFIRKKDLVYVAARPSMGKSTLAQNLFVSVSRYEQGVPVFFSIEMPSSDLILRLSSSIGTINLANLITGGKASYEGKLTEYEWTAIAESTNFIAQSKMRIDDETQVSIPYIYSTLNKVMQETGEPISMVLLDYLGLMQEVRQAENKQQAVEKVSRALKQIAIEFDCPVVVLAQLNRSLENRPNKRPIMSDLRDSGALEQDADKIIFLYRDEVYNPNSDAKGTAELIIGKNRQGKTSVIQLGFEGQFSRFTNLTLEYYQAMNEQAQPF